MVDHAHQEDVVSPEILTPLGLRQEDGMFVDKSDCSHETLEDAVQSGFLGFCGCDDPLENIFYIANMLATESNRNYEPLLLCDEPPSGWRRFFLYWAEEVGLTEHGSSINGSWLTARGSAFIRAAKLMRGEA